MPSAEAFDTAFQEKRQIGSIVSVNGSHAMVMLDADEAVQDRAERPQLGAIISIDAGANVTLGLISALSDPSPDHQEGAKSFQLAEAELIGEFMKPTINAPAQFRRGVSSFPTLGDIVHVATRDELTALFAVTGAAGVRLGVVKHDTSIPAVIDVDALFARHCAFLGSTGSGKSCAAALLLRAVLARFPHAHMVLLDPYNEYSKSFDDRAHVLNQSNFSLPNWVLTFDELVAVLYPQREGFAEEIEVLADIVLTAKKSNFAGQGRSGIVRADTSAVTVDTPTPYRVSELIALIDKALGALGSSHNVAPYKRLRNRIYAVTQDARFGFMFGHLSVQDTLADLLGQLFRIPARGQPVSIIELGGLPSEVTQVVVSVVSRLALEFGQWSRGAAPIAVVCEEAHRYAPCDPSLGFAPARRALLRLAKEGQKVGVSLWLVSQRPSELDPTVLSQCNTILAMRLANQSDQAALRAATPDASTSLLDCLASLGLGEAVIFGEAIPMPTRIRFDALPRDAIPRSLTASFTDGWSVAIEDEEFVERIVEQWRAQKIITPEF
ncbi:MAG: ATP-binding protein [Pseudomonadota bacterium]